MERNALTNFITLLMMLYYYNMHILQWNKKLNHFSETQTHERENKIHFYCRLVNFVQIFQV